MTGDWKDHPGKSEELDISNLVSEKSEDLKDPIFYPAEWKKCDVVFFHLWELCGGVEKIEEEYFQTIEYSS